MKNAVGVLIVVCLLGGVAIGNCLNNEKGKKHVLPDPAGNKKYRCFIKSNDLASFENGYCKKCGCSNSDHDNLARQLEKQPEKSPK